MFALTLGIVRKGGQRAVSNMAVNQREIQTERTNEWASRTTININNFQLNLQEIRQLSKKSRGAETYCVLKGLEKHARSEGLKPVFITLTAPPRFHANPSHGEKSWDGSSPAQAQQWIMKEWAKLRARLAKNDITLSGLRVGEAHGDGCPHAHLLVYANESYRELIEKEIRFTWTEDKSCEIRWLDDKAGASAASYVMKYVLKTIYGEEGKEDRDDAWRSIWGVRGIQFFGLPSLSLWREVRKLEADENRDHNLSLLRRYAKENDFNGFLTMCGGIGIKNNERPFQAVIGGDENEKVIVFSRRNEIIEVVKRVKAVIETTPLPAGYSYCKLPKETQNQPREEADEWFCESEAETKKPFFTTAPPD